MTLLKKIPQLSVIVIFCLIITSFLIYTEYSMSHRMFDILLKGICAALLCVLIAFRCWQKKFSLSMDEYIVSAYCLWVLATRFFVPREDNFLLGLFHPVIFLLCYAGISSFYRTVTGNIDLKQFVKALLAITIFLAFTHFVIAIIIGSGATTMFAPRANLQDYLEKSYQFDGLLHNPNIFGFQMMLGAIASFSLFIDTFITSKRKAMLFIPFLMLFVFGLLVSASRSSVMGFILYIIITFFIFFIKKNSLTLKAKLYHASMAFLSIAGIFLIFQNHTLNFIKKFSNGTSLRTQIWSDFLNSMVSSFPSIKLFLGEGYSAFRIDSWQTLIHTHNFFLEIWGREGIISALIIIALLVYLLFKNIRSFQLWFIIGLPFAIVARDMFEVTMVVRVLRWEMIVFWLFLLLPLYYYNDNQLKEGVHH